VQGQPFFSGPKVHVSYIVIGEISKTYHFGCERRDKLTVGLLANVAVTLDHRGQKCPK
jgi:hypothetical protein